MPEAFDLSSPASFATFGDLLKHLRLRAQLTQRELALATGYNHAHISRLESNQRLPDAATLKALFVPALGLENEPEWTLRLLDLAAEGRGETPAEVAIAAPVEPGSAPASARVVRLPVPLTPLLGRDVAAEAARSMVMHATIRLMTLLGPPGIGKTRLALRVAAEVEGDFADGVVFVDLTSIRDPGLVPDALAQALEVKESAGQPLDVSLRAALRDRQLLVVLDNFEQVVEAAPQVASWLGMAPGLKILVTSREALRINGEHEFQVPPLSVPDVVHLPADAGRVVEALSPYTSIQLFVQRAQALRSDFQLTPENAPAIAELCARLDGLPLAIELAAARIKLFTPQAMLARLDSRLHWLTGGPRDGPAWRQTLRGAIDWSYNLLEADEQALFARLAVFAGGFTSESAAVVCGVSDSFLMLDRLSALADKSLLTVMTAATSAAWATSATSASSVAASPGDEPRFTLLETLREYALECLAEKPEQHTAARRAHADYFVWLVGAAAPELKGAQVAVWLNRLEIEHDNLRAALAWTLAQTDGQSARLAASLWPFWHQRGYFSEARRWLTQALANAVGPEQLALTRLLGEACWNLGELSVARAYLEASLSLARTSQDRAAAADVLSALGRVIKDLGDYAEAKRYLEEGVALARELNNQAALVSLLRNLGNVNVDLGRFAEASQCYEESLALARGRGDRFSAAGALNNLGLVFIMTHAFAQAQACFQEALAIFETDGNQMGMTLTYVNLGRVAHAHRQLTEAREFYQKSLSLARAIGKKWSEAYALNNLGLVAGDLGDWATATQAFREGLQTALEAGALPRVLDGLAGWAAWLAHTNQSERAIELLGLVLQHVATEHETTARAQELLAQLRCSQPAEMVEAALRQGQASEWEGITRAILLAPRSES